MGRSRTATTVLRYESEGADRAAKQAREVEDSLQRVDKAAQASAKTATTSLAKVDTDVVGRADTAASALGGLAGALDIAGAESLMLGADVLGAVDAVQMFRREMVETGVGLRGVLMELGPIALVAGAGAVAFAALSAAIDASRRAAEVRIEQINKVATEEIRVQELVRSSSSSAIRDQIAALEESRRVRIEERDAAVAAAQELATQGTGIEQFLSVAAGGAKATFDEIVNMNIALGESEVELRALRRALDEVTAAEERRARALGIIQEAEFAAQLEMQRAAIIRTATVEGIQTSIAVENERLVALKRQLLALRAASDGSDEFITAIANTEASIKQSADQLKFLETQALSTATARDNEKKAAEASEKALDDATKAKQKEAQILDKFNERRAALEKRQADRLIQIAEQAAEAQERALRNLQQSLSDLERDLGRETAEAERELQRDRLEAQIDYQRDEAKAARDHARDLRRIQEDAQDAEFEMIANRDFAALFFSRRQTRRDIERAGEDYSVERSERSIAYSEQRADLQRAFEQERQDRLIQYQQSRMDARAAYEQERAEIEANRVRALEETRQSFLREQAELKAKTMQELGIKRAGAQKELRLAAETSQQKIMVATQEKRAIAALASQTVQAIGQVMTSARAFTSMSQNNTFNIRGRDPEGIGREVNRRVQAGFRQITT